MHMISNPALADQTAYLAACANARTRARHSYFTQYVISDEEAGYLAIDEGDYTALPPHLIARVVHAVPGDLDEES
jgi:hypothetical protein